MRPGTGGFVCWCGRAAISVIHSNVHLGVAVKGFVDVVNLCSQVQVKEIIMLHRVVGLIDSAERPLEKN